MINSPNYIIYAPSFNENNGGCIVLHKLCHMLNQLGEQAFLWPMERSYKKRRRDRILSYFKPESFEVSKEFNTPIATAKDINDNSIVIYPEIVNGNPLKHKNVVRWFLHKPGYHTGKVEYGKNELYFIFDKFSDDPSINKNPENELFVVQLNQVYKNNNGDRSGSCYLIRKSRNKEIVHDFNGSVKIDGMSHSENAAIFNKTEYFYCYDEMTMYSQFAALCGCISVVIPSCFDNREDWVKAHPISKYGIAYGMDDIEHAKSTSHLVREYFEDQESESLLTVKKFIVKTYDKFLN